MRITIPPGGIDNIEVAGFEIDVSTRSPEPFSDVEMTVGPPISETVTIIEPGNPEWEWMLSLPEDCEEGCELRIPVTITQVEDGSPPRFTWSADLYFDYGSVTAVPDAARDISAEIVPAGE